MKDLRLVAALLAVVSVSVLSLSFLWNTFLLESRRNGVRVELFTTTCVRGESKESVCVRGGLPIRLLFSKNEVVIIPMGPHPKRKGDLYFKSPGREMAITNQNVVYLVEEDGFVSFVWQPGYEIHEEMKRRLKGKED